MGALLGNYRPLLHIFFAARCIASAAYAVMRCVVCLSVCLSVCVRHVRTFCQNELTYLRNFSPSGSHTILVFFHTKRHGNIPTGTSQRGRQMQMG